MLKFALSCVAAAIVSMPTVASAAIKVYSFNLDGSQEVPVTPSPAAGSAQITVDDVADTISFAVVAFNLQGSFAAAHIHFAPVGVNGPVVFNLVTTADFSGPVTIGTTTIPNSWSLVGSNKAAGSLADAINAAPWDYYVNLHTSSYPGGEIRGQLAPVPEPATYGMLALGLGLVGWVAARRRAG
jgi:hypothetical protein